MLFTESYATENINSFELKSFELSLKNFELAKTNLENKIEECEKKKIIVPETIFRGLILTKEEWKIALYVLSSRAEDVCELGKRGDCVIAASIYRTTAKHYNRDAKSATPYSEDLLFGHYWKKLELEAQYLNIPNKKRKKLEKIPQFQKPFYLFETLSILNKSFKMYD